MTREMSMSIYSIVLLEMVLILDVPNVINQYIQGLYAANATNPQRKYLSKNTLVLKAV